MPSTSPPDPPPEDHPEAAELPLDIVFEILSNPRRRFILRYLLAESETATLGELAERIASIENDKPEDALSAQERKRVYVALYQLHTPKMADAGVIDFDDDEKTVEAGENVEQVARFLPEEADYGSPGKSEEWMSAFSDLARALGRRLRNPQTILSPRTR